MTATLVQVPVASAAPANPSDGQLRSAGAQVAQRAAAVGRLTAQVASKDAEIQRLQDLAELAMEQYNKAQADLQAADAAQQRTKVAATAAQAEVRRSRQAAQDFARSAYVAGGLVGSYGALFTAANPTEFLLRADYVGYTSRHQVDLLGQVDRAKVRNANADSAARLAVVERRLAAAEADRAKVVAARRVADSRTQLTALRAQKASLEAELEQARVRANGLRAERRRYEAWRQEQAAAAARERARQAELRRKVGAGASHGGSGTWTGGRGGWSAAKGEFVARAALRWLGQPYAWGGGNAQGPTYGVNGPDGGWNDSQVYGFDCSGLTLWAWAQAGAPLPHYSGYQYFQGSVHPSVGGLMPGDLVFWSYDGTAGGIHHVAIYLGGGQIIQAPQSGDVVKISSMWYSGYFGAVRPGS
ncbi:MAG: C40 family peptidase [Actinobacteria bacterium]|nr:C40 family peptidase [Actinomycetota bacterium]